jgi:hypothetical protein
LVAVGVVLISVRLNKALKYYQKGYKYGNLAAPVGIAIIYRKQHKYIKERWYSIISYHFTSNI